MDCEDNDEFDEDEDDDVVEEVDHENLNCLRWQSHRQGFRCNSRLLMFVKLEHDIVTMMLNSDDADDFRHVNLDDKDDTNNDDNNDDDDDEPEKDILLQIGQSVAFQGDRLHTVAQVAC